MRGRGVLNLTDSVHLSHSEDGICSRSSSPLARAKQLARSAHKKCASLILCARERT